MKKPIKPLEPSPPAKFNVRTSTIDSGINFNTDISIYDESVDSLNLSITGEKLQSLLKFVMEVCETQNVYLTDIVIEQYNTYDKCLISFPLQEPNPKFEKQSIKYKNDLIIYEKKLDTYNKDKVLYDAYLKTKYKTDLEKEFLAAKKHLATLENKLKSKKG
jgi:hypothetical protein